MKFALCLLACLATAPVTAIETTANTITLSEAEVQLGKSRGGWVLVTQAKLDELLDEARAQGKAEAADDAKETACARDWKAHA